MITRRVAGLACERCGDAELVSVEPGWDADIDATTDIVLKPGRAPRGWCIRCWPWSPPQPNLFPEPLV